MKIGGIPIRWSEPPQTQKRSLAQITDDDIGLAMDERIRELSGILDIDVAAVFRARQLTADTVASLPMEQLFGKTVTAELPELLASPDPTETYHDTMSSLMFDLIDEGDGFLWVKAFDSIGNPRSVYVVDEGEVSVSWDRRRLYRQYAWRGDPMEEGRNFFHIAINRKKGDLRGRGVLEAARDTTIATLKAQSEMALSMAEDNYTPTLLLKHPSVTDKRSAQLVRDMYVSDRDKRGRNVPAATSTQTEIEQMTINPVDAEWVESRAFEIQETARLFGLPGWMLLVDQGSSMTYSNTEGVMRFWATMTLRPTYLERIEQTFSRMLPEGRKARFNMDEILRADLAARYQAYQLGIESEFLLPNEAREGEGLAPIAGGDSFSRSREIAEIIQKLYLGVGVVLSEEEARRIVSAAGASLPGGIRRTPSTNGAVNV